MIPALRLGPREKGQASPSEPHGRCFLAGLPEDCKGRWESFVEETLVEANRRNTVDLVSGSVPLNREGGGGGWCRKRW